MNLRFKLLSSVLAIILGMAAVTVMVGGSWIGDEIRRDTVATIAGTATNYQAAETDVASSLSQAILRFSKAPVLKAVIGEDNAPTAAHLLATQMEDTRADTFLWMHRSGKPAVFLRRTTTAGEPTGQAWVADLAASGVSSDPFDFGGDEGSTSETTPEEDLAQLLATTNRRWTVSKMPATTSEEPFVKHLAKISAETSSALKAPGAEVVEDGESSITSWDERLYLFAYRPLIYGGRNFDGILAAGFQIDDSFAGRVASLTQAELTFLRVPKDSAARVVASGVGDGGSTVEASRRAASYSDLYSRGGLTVGPPDTLTFQEVQYVVQAEILPVLPGSDSAVRIIAGNLTEHLGILAVLNKTLLGVTGVAAVFAVLLLGMGMGVWVNRPVAQLTEGMRRIQAGDLTTQISVTSEDEMGELADAYNQMLGELKKKEAYMRMVSKSAVKAVETRGRANLEEGGERRVVTVLFSDIRGFTTLCERIDPNRLVELLNRYFDVMVEIIYRHNGMLDKFIGDAIMAIFEGENHPRNAILASLEMMAECERLDREENLGIKIGVGLHTGDVIAGFVGAKQFMNHTYLGDTVNVSARLEGLSKHGRHTKVVISQATFDEVPGMLDVERMEIDHVKGKTEAVHMYEIVRLKKTREIFVDIEEGDVEVRAKSALILGRLGGAEALPQLLQLTRDPDFPVVEAALSALRGLPLSPDQRSSMHESLAALLKDSTSGRIRSSVVRVLGHAGGQEQVSLVLEMMHDSEPRVRANAVEAIDELNSNIARMAIRPMLEDTNNRVRANAAMVLFDDETDLVADRLCKGLQDEDVLQRSSSCYAVWNLADRYPKALRDPEKGQNLNHRSYRIHSAFQRLTGSVVALLPREEDEMVLRNLIPALKSLLGAEAARQLVSDAFSDAKKRELSGSGVLRLEVAFGGQVPSEET